MKISIITVVLNRRDTIGAAISSLYAQTFGAFEHIVVDGGSTDGTLEALCDCTDARTLVESAPDQGIYDALNKGLARATGDVVGVLHSDDRYAAADVLAQVAQAFDREQADAVYGDLRYVSQNSPDLVRRNWRSGAFRAAALRRGWMPPHPTLFLRRNIIEAAGGYDRSYRISGDYDAILRWFSRPGFRAVHLPKVLIEMRAGGISNGTLAQILLKSREDLRAIRANAIGGPEVLLAKNLRKFGQFL